MRDLICGSPVERFGNAASVVRRCGYGIAAALLSAAACTGVQASEADVQRAIRQAEQAAKREAAQAAREARKREAEQKRAARQEEVRQQRQARQVEAQRQRQARQAEAQQQREARQQAAAAQRAAQQEAAAARRAALEAERQAELARSCDSIKAWLEAGPVPVSTNPRASDGAVAVLIRDERFAPVFGARYDAMPQTELQALSRAAARCFGLPDGPLASLPPHQKSLVNGALSSSRQPANVQHLARARAADETLASLAEALDGLQPTETDYARLLDIERRGNGVLALASEARRSDYSQRFAAADVKVAIPVLGANVRRTVDEARGIDGLRALARLEDQQHVAAGVRGDGMRSPQAVRARGENQRLIESRLAEIAQDVAAAEKQRIDALGSGTVALERGVQWHADYREHVQPYASRAKALATVLPYFTEKRAAALEQAQEELQQAAAGMTAHEDLQRLQARYLLDADARTVPGTVILTAIARQGQEIDKRAALGRPAAAQAAVLEQAAPSPGTPARSAQPTQPTQPTQSASSASSASSTQASSGEPSEDVMYDLVRSVLDEAAQRQASLLAQCRGGGLQGSDATMAYVCGVYMLSHGAATGTLEAQRAPKILQFEKLGCAPAVGQAGYLCDYQLAVEKNLNPAFVGPQAKALLEGPSLKQARFLQSRNGWLIIYSEDAVQ